MKTITFTKQARRYWPFAQATLVCALLCACNFDGSVPNEAHITNVFPELAISDARYRGDWGDNDRNAFVYWYTVSANPDRTWAALSNRMRDAGWSWTNPTPTSLCARKVQPAYPGKRRLTELRASRRDNVFAFGLVDNIVPAGVRTLAESREADWLVVRFWPRYEKASHP
jgi:hypothetical protein